MNQTPWGFNQEREPLASWIHQVPPINTILKFGPLDLSFRAPSQQENSSFNRASWDCWKDKHNSPESRIQAKYIYEPLPFMDSIRLLKLAPGRKDDTLRGTVVVSRLDAQTKYTAISYTWGDCKEVKPLVINDTIMPIRQDVAQALSTVEECEKQQFLWVDAICINQSDEVEKATQIRRMAEIYHHAESVMVWLQTHNGSLGGQPGKDVLYSNSMPFGGHRAQSLNYKPFLYPHLTVEASKTPCGLRWPETSTMNLRSQWRPDLSDFAEIKSRLHKLLSACADDEFPMLSIALSTTLTSFRALRPIEIARVAALSMSVGTSPQTMDDMTRFLSMRGLYQGVKSQYLEAMLQSKWSDILYIDAQGGVRFTTESVGHFLSRFQICGIDSKHEVMANACLRELEFGTILAELDHGFDGNASHPLCALSDLSLYAAQFWQLHYRLAQNLSPGLSERLHKLLWGQIRDFRHPRVADQVSPKASCSFCSDCVETAFAYCKSRGFEVLGKAYAQLKTNSPEMTLEYEAVREDRKLPDQVYTVETTLPQYHVRSDIERNLRYCQISSSEAFCPVTSRHINWDTDDADSTLSDFESDWLMVSSRNTSSISSSCPG
ncbi:hypothetical protein H2198_009569 [Neophaeococcomyces mojaviensis]|uniref:Uncharacterized protein n=1 Tax=Neophaeococcomyces mojaviensis TaxID=3383035 RepID=A0ACC2ZUB7_9EURO|nr:hypothetical protein H2198_009569 [Knufia sp. JES_112]